MMDDFRPREPGMPQPHEQIPEQQPVAHTASIATHPFWPEAEQPSLTPAHTGLPDLTDHVDHTDTTNDVTTDRRGIFAKLRHLSKKQRIIIGVAVFVLVAGGLFAAFKPDKKQAAVVVTKKSSAGAPVSTTVPSYLTGLQVEPATNSRQVTGVMIENSTEARPQSGLNAAGLVFEAIAEGGITRFLALYQDTQSAFIGPVRSVRPYYLQWCQGVDCAIAHVGGSPEALQNIKDWNVKNLDQFAGASFFQRVGSRAAPHNVYTSGAQLAAYENSRGYTASTYTALQHLTKEAPVNAASQNAKAINLNYPGSAYDVHYDYDAASNSYKRSEGGAPHMVVDAANGSTQISPKVVIAIAVPRTLQTDHKHNTYAVVGSGAVYIFQSGTATAGTWSKASPTAQLTFVDAKGAPIKLNPGQAWISALDTIGDATFN
jgi:hypothetical protein